MNSALLHLKGIHKSFGQTPVLKDIHLSLHQGEILFLLGASGCGKTTLLRIVAGFEQADRGSMHIGQRLIFDEQHFLPPKDRKLGYVLQEGVLFPHLNVYRNIAYGLGKGKAKTQAEKDRIAEVMALTGISDLAERMPHQISGGQQQRVALARALAPKPALLLLDEPFSALDEHLRAQIRTDITDILRRSQSAAIIVTHDRHEALSCADKIAVIQAGQLVQLDTPQNLYQRPKTIDVARFMNEHSVLLPAQLCGHGSCAQTALIKEVPIVLPADEAPQEAAHVQGHLLLRADQFALATTEAETDFFAHIKSIDFHGAYSQLELDAQGTAIHLNMSHFVAGLHKGDQVGLKVLGAGVFYS